MLLADLIAVDSVLDGAAALTSVLVFLVVFGVAVLTELEVFLTSEEVFLTVFPVLVPDTAVFLVELLLLTAFV